MSWDSILHSINNWLEANLGNANTNATVVPDYHVQFKQELANYFSLMLKNLPDYCNIEKVSALGIVVNYVDASHATVEIPKATNLEELENPRNVSLRWIPSMNSIFANIRIKAENDVDAVRYETQAKLVQIYNECWYTGNLELWNCKSSELTNAYWNYVYKQAYLLCGVQIVDYFERDGKFIFSVLIDNKCRIATDLA